MRRKKRQPFDDKGGIAAIQRRLIESDAYLGLSAQSKALLHLLHVHWRPHMPVGYGIREAMRKIPCAKTTAQNAFRELQNCGFIEMVDESLFNSRSGSRSRTWRLTWLPYLGKFPTNDWEKLGDPSQNEAA